MKFSALLLSALFLSMTAHASVGSSDGTASSSAPVEFTCSARHEFVNLGSYLSTVSDDFTIGVAAQKINFKGFVISGSVSPECMSDGGNCVGGDLRLSISKDKVKSFTFLSASDMDPSLVSTELEVNDEVVLVNCQMK